MCPHPQSWMNLPQSLRMNFPAGIQLGLLVDPISRAIFTFKKDACGVVRRRNRRWRDVSFHSGTFYLVSLWKCGISTKQPPGYVILVFPIPSSSTTGMTMREKGASMIRARFIREMVNCVISCLMLTPAIKPAFITHSGVSRRSCGRHTTWLALTMQDQQGYAGW